MSRRSLPAMPASNRSSPTPARWRSSPRDMLGRCGSDLVSLNMQVNTRNGIVKGIDRRIPCGRIGFHSAAAVPRDRWRKASIGGARRPDNRRPTSKQSASKSSSTMCLWKS